MKEKTITERVNALVEKVNDLERRMHHLKLIPPAPVYTPEHSSHTHDGG